MWCVFKKCSNRPSYRSMPFFYMRDTGFELKKTSIESKLAIRFYYRIIIEIHTERQKKFDGIDKISTQHSFFGCLRIK